jgi:NADPH-dependent curcumin reductase CurA
MRGWMNPGASYIEPVEVGAVMRAGAVGRVIASRHPTFRLGDHVVGMFGVQDFAVSEGRGVVKADPDLAPLPTYLGALGMTGLTAYFGLLDVGRVKEGDTVVVSGAAGAVGSVAGQIARIKGARVIGIAGGPEKCSWLVDELGFDAAIDYKAGPVAVALREHPRVDVYFDNVGGEILDAVLTRLNRGARIIICGAISQYNAEQMRGPANYMSLLVNRASMTGMVVFDWAERYGEGTAELAGWYRSGQLVAREDLVTGSVDSFPDVLLKLFAGENTGKLVLQLER